MKKWNLGIFGLFMAVLTSCETDVDLIQEYESQSFIFGLLDQHEDTQYVRVNKAFLGTLNINDMASVRDSIHYQPGDLKIEINLKSYLNRQGRIDIDRNETYELQELSHEKNTGFFNNDDYIVYYMTNPIVQQENFEQVDYQLYVTNNITGRVDSANSPIQLIKDVILKYPNPNTNIASFTKFSSAGYQLLPTYDIEWESTLNADKHETYVRFYYDEITLSTKDTTTYSFDYFVGNSYNSGGNSGRNLKANFSAENFYKEIGNQLEVKTGIQRIRPRIQIYMIIASQDFSLYIDASAPTNDINQNRPNYSNLSNGLGIFGARNEKFVTNRDLNFNQGSLEVLISYQATRNLSFKQI